MFKKILLLIILVMAMVGCTAHDMALWKEARRESKEDRCYRDSSGYAYCVDKYRNRVY